MPDAEPPVDAPADPRALAADATFGPEFRLHSNRDYGRVFHRQQKAAGRTVVVLVQPRSRRSGSLARLGVMMSAKVVRTSVRRHQLKRWVRELFRTRLKAVLHGFDAVVLFRHDPPDAPEAHARLDTEILALAARAVASPATPGQRGGRPRGRSAGQGGGKPKNHGKGPA
jgi:ribonuclease P protein component